MQIDARNRKIFLPVPGANPRSCGLWCHSDECYTVGESLAVTTKRRKHHARLMPLLEEQTFWNTVPFRLQLREQSTGIMVELVGCKRSTNHALSRDIYLQAERLLRAFCLGLYDYQNTLAGNRLRCLIGGQSPRGEVYLAFNSQNAPRGMQQIAGLLGELPGLGELEQSYSQAGWTLGLPADAMTVAQAGQLAVGYMAGAGASHLGIGTYR